MGRKSEVVAVSRLISIGFWSVLSRWSLGWIM